MICVLGFREAMASTTSALLPLEQRVAVVCLPMLVVFKIIAWSERRTRERGRDAPDLMLILANYLEAGQEECLYAEEDHLLSAKDFDFERAESWLAGKDALNLLRLHSDNSTRIERAVRSGCNFFFAAAVAGVKLECTWSEPYSLQSRFNSHLFHKYTLLQ